MATQLPRPGVEVVQEFQSVSPTVVTPTLVPCVIAPYFEVIETLNSDGTLNDDALLADPYVQLDTVVSQSSFPSPRSNIDEVDVLEDTIRAFLSFGGAIVEMKRTSGFLVGQNIASKPFCETSGVVGTVDLDGKTLTVALDAHTSIPDPTVVLAADNVTVTFEGTALTLADVITQINTVLPNVASNASGKLRLSSTKYGASASVCVRSSGSANFVLGIADGGKDQLAVGGGFYAVDDSDGDLTSPRVQVYRGTTQRDIDVVDVPDITAPDFTTLQVESGDTLYADGVNIGDVELVSSDRLIMEVEQNLFAHDKPFAPRYLWIQANGLSYPAPASSVAATVTGTKAAVAATVPYIVSGDISYSGGDTFTTPIAAGEAFHVGTAAAGVSQGSEEVVIQSGGVATLTALVAAINAAATYFEAYRANKYGIEAAAGLYLGLRTKSDNVGSGAIITFESASAGFTATIPLSANTSDVGENERFRPGTAPFVVSGSLFSLIQPLVSTEFTSTTVLWLGAATSPASETITWAGNHATIAAAIADWNSQALFTEAYEANASGVETVGGGYFAIRTVGDNIGSTASLEVTAADSKPTIPVTAATPGVDVAVDGAKFKWSIDQNSKEYEAIFVADEDDGGLSLQQIIDKINELTPGVASEDGSSPPKLMLTSNKVGGGSEIEILAPGGDTLTFLGFSVGSTLGVGRPNPDLAIDTNGNAVLQGQVLRDGLTGYPFADGVALLYFAYKGLRLDMSPDADDPSLITWNDVTSVEQVAPPISIDNPGSLMSYLALVNAPTVSVASIGVPEVSADAPDGTPLGYTKALEFLQSEEVYALALASQLGVVHQAALTHVDAMSEPENKGERILFFNPPVPDRAQNTSLGSGTDANSTGLTNQVKLDGNLSPALVALGINPNEDINPLTGEIEYEIYLDLGTDDNYYLIQKVENGDTVTVRTSFAAGDGNEDSFFSIEDLPSTVISADWSVFKRGAPLLQSGSTSPDYQAIAETVQGIGTAYGKRRGFYVFPDACGINVGGLEQQVEGYYATAAIVGMVGQQPPQQGFTNFPIAGLTTVIGSNDTFTETQLNIMAAGGVYILVQDVEGGPVTCRHQLSTDMTSVEARELSITKCVDYTAKLTRAGLRNFIGRNNITPPFLDQLGTVVQGLMNFLIENGVLVGADVNNVIQDEDNPDTVLIDITLDVPYPCNYIRVTLII